MWKRGATPVGPIAGGGESLVPPSPGTVRDEPAPGGAVVPLPHELVALFEDDRCTDCDGIGLDALGDLVCGTCDGYGRRHVEGKCACGSYHWPRPSLTVVPDPAP